MLLRRTAQIDEIVGEDLTRHSSGAPRERGTKAG
jgi:hypothetical protein